jgi:hypothetical protein
VFRRWEGMEGLISPKVTGVVDKPVILTAIYERQVKLKIDAAHGSSGEGWHRVGTVATATVPDSISQMLLFKSAFVGFSGHAAGQPTVQVLMDEPVVLTALYRNDVNSTILAALLSSILLAVVLLSSPRWLPLLYRRPTRNGRVVAHAPPRVDASHSGAVAPARHGGSNKPPVSPLVRDRR